MTLKFLIGKKRERARRLKGLQSKSRIRAYNTRDNIVARVKAGMTRSVGRSAWALNSTFSGYVGRSPFPSHKMYKLHYKNTHTMTVGTSGTLGAIQKYNLNSVFDPDSTGVGHQPYGYDALQVAYNRYKVIGCDVRLTLTDPDGDGVTVVYMITNPSNSAETIAGVNPDAVTEKAMSGSLDINDSGDQIKNTKVFIPMYKAAGLTKLLFNADPDNFTAAVTANPGNLILLQFAAADRRNGSSKTVIVMIDLIYSVVMYNRKVMAQS